MVAVLAIALALAEPPAGRAAVVSWHLGANPAAVGPGLMAARRDPDPAVRRVANRIWAEAGAGTRAALPFVRRSLATPTDPQAVAKAAEALAKPGFAAVPAVLDAVAEEPAPDRMNRSYAAELVGVVSSPSAVVPLADRFHEAAARALAKLSPAVVPTLVAALDEPSAAVREVAASALGRLGEAARPAVPPLIGRFADRDAGVRERAAEAVGRIGPDAAATPALVTALNHRDAAVRRVAVAALVQRSPISDAVRGALDDPDPAVRLTAAEGLVRADPPFRPALVALVDELSGRDPTARTRAAATLAAQGDRIKPATAELVQACDGPTKLGRLAAGRLLAKLGGPTAEAATALVRESLTDDTPAVRVAAAEALAQAGQFADAVPVLVAALGSNDGSAQAAAGQAFQQLPTSGEPARKLAPVLAETLADLPKNSRYQVFNLLQRMRADAKPAAPALLKLLKSADGDSGRQALAVLTAVGAVDAAAAPDLAEALRAQADGYACRQLGDLLANLGPAAKAAVPGLLKALADGRPAARMAALRGLRAVSPADVANAGPALAELIQSPNAEVRRQAFDLIGELGKSAPAAVGPLLAEAVGSADPQVRMLAVNALNRSDGPLPAEVRAAARQAVRTGDAEGRLQLVSLLERHGRDEADVLVPALTELLAAPQAGTRLRAAEALGRQPGGWEQAVPVFRAGLTAESPNDRLSAARQLLQSGRGDVPAADRKAAAAVAAAVVGTADRNVRQMAIFALQSVRSPELLRPAADGLRQALADDQPYLRVQAAQILARIPGEPRADALRALADMATLGSRDQFQRQQALQALRGMGPDAAAVVVPILVEQLRNPATRAAAASELSQFPRSQSTAARPVLRELLADPNPNTRLTAATALVRSGDPADTSAAAAALKALTVQPGPVRPSAAAALVELGPPHDAAARPVYVEMLGDANSNNRLTAARQLLTDEAARPLVVPVLQRLMTAGSGYERAQAAQLLAQAVPAAKGEALAVLVELVNNRADVRSSAVATMVAVGADRPDVVVPALRAVLAGPDRFGKLSAVSAAGQLGPAAAPLLPELAPLLAMPDAGTQVGYALGRIGPAALPTLLDGLNGGRTARSAAASGLAQLGAAAAPAVPTLFELLVQAPDSSEFRYALQRVGPAAVGVLAARLADPDPARRRVAADALSGFGTRSARLAVEKAAADPDPGVRQAAAVAAFRAGSRAPAVVAGMVEGLSANELPRRHAAAQATYGQREMPPAVRAALELRLADADGTVRGFAAAALVKQPATAVAAGTVLARLLDEDEAAQGLAAAALAAPGVPVEALTPAVDGLRRLAGETGGFTYDGAGPRAAVALHRAGRPDGVRLLVEAIAVGPTGGFGGPAAALAECGPDGWAALRTLAVTGSAYARGFVITQLGQSVADDPANLRTLVGLLADASPTIRLRALAALATAGPAAAEAGEAVAARLTDPAPAVRTEAAVAVAHLGTPAGREAALPLLLPSLAEWPGPASTLARVVEAVGRFGPAAKAAVPTLVQLANRGDPAVAPKAVESLGRIGPAAKWALPTVHELLKSPDDLLRTPAAVALWRIAGRADLPALLRALDDPDQRPQPPPVRLAPGQRVYVSQTGERSTAVATSAVEVIRTLGEVGPTAAAALDRLRELAAGDGPLAKAAADAVAKIAPPEDRP
jgi:HEAT repeat protein